MDLTSVLGLVLAVLSISVGDILEGGNPLHVIHLSSCIIIIPTTMFAAMAGTHASAVKAAFKEFKIIFMPPKVDLSARVKEITELSSAARRDGILSLEGRAAGIEDDFLREGLNMVIDGREAKSVHEDLEIKIEQMEHHYHAAAHYWIMAGESAPTFGLVGAVLGLMLALQLLDDPTAMAMGIAGAFTATVTGIMTAYAIFGPWGNKMKANAGDIIKEKEMMMAGILGIANGENPRNLEAKLFGFLPPGVPRVSQFE